MSAASTSAVEIPIYYWSSRASWQALFSHAEYKAHGKVSTNHPLSKTQWTIMPKLFRNSVFLVGLLTIREGRYSWDQSKSRLDGWWTFFPCFTGLESWRRISAQALWWIQKYFYSLLASTYFLDLKRSMIVSEVRFRRLYKRTRSRVWVWRSDITESEDVVGANRVFVKVIAAYASICRAYSWIVPTWLVPVQKFLLCIMQLIGSVYKNVTLF